MRDYLLCSARHSLVAAFTALRLMECCVKNIEAPVVFLKGSVRWIKQNRTYEGSGAVSARVKQVRKIRKRCWQRDGKFAGTMNLRIHAGENRGLRLDRQRGLRVSLRKNNSLAGDGVEVRSDSAVSTQESHAAGA